MSASQNAIRKIQNLIENDSSIKDTDILEIKSGNQWINEAKKKPIPNRLFDSFWYENEICILFADTNIGKSILAAQIADSISRGRPIKGFVCEVPPARVLYLDFELSEKQFEKRCSVNYTNHYEFHENFLRGEIKQDFQDSEESIESRILKNIRDSVIRSQIRVVIIDNLTFLGSDNEKGKNALELMKKLKAMGRELNLSILILAHTPKRNQFSELNLNHLAGSRQLMNFCDSCFAIGGSALDTRYRYLKQIKQRNTECVYDSLNVVVCEIESVNSLLSFILIRLEPEFNHLKQINADTHEERDATIKELKSQGLTNTEIAKQFGLTEGAIRNRLKQLS